MLYWHGRFFCGGFTNCWKGIIPWQNRDKDGTIEPDIEFRTMFVGQELRAYSASEPEIGVIEVPSESYFSSSSPCIPSWLLSVALINGRRSSLIDMTPGLLHWPAKMVGKAVEDRHRTGTMFDHCTFIDPKFSQKIFLAPRR